jgi:hypothetical protein
MARGRTIRGCIVTELFQIYLDEELLYSKLRLKQFPNFESVVTTIRLYMDQGGTVEVR